MARVRIGNGYDVHRLTPGRKLIIGGVNIPYNNGLAGHSDADVLAHAVIDAILGAHAMGDIGKMFPDTNKDYEGISSIELLKTAVKKCEAFGYAIGNIDSIIVAQAPKLSPYIEKMRQNIANAVRCDISQISVKATTEEFLGFTGEGLGIAAHAVCIIEKM